MEASGPAPALYGRRPHDKIMEEHMKTYDWQPVLGLVVMSATVTGLTLTSVPIISSDSVQVVV